MGLPATLPFAFCERLNILFVMKTGRVWSNPGCSEWFHLLEFVIGMGG